MVLLIRVRDVCCESLLLYFRVRRFVYMSLHPFAHVGKDFVMWDRHFIVRQVGKAIYFPLCFPTLLFSLFFGQFLIRIYFIFDGNIFPGGLAFKALHGTGHLPLIINPLVDGLNWCNIFLLLWAEFFADINHEVLINDCTLFILLGLNHGPVIVLLNHLSHGLIFSHYYLWPWS